MEKRTDLFFFSSEMCKQSCMQSPYRHSGRACIHSCIHSCKHSCIQKGSVRKGGCKIAERSRLIIGTKSCPGFFSSIGYLPKYYCCVGHFSLLRWPSIIASLAKYPLMLRNRIFRLIPRRSLSRFRTSCPGGSDALCRLSRRKAGEGFVRVRHSNSCQIHQ